MQRIVIVGAGGIGTLTAQHLLTQHLLTRAATGHTVPAAAATEPVEVVVASRSGSARLAGAEAVAVDAADTEAMTRLAGGASVLINAVNPTSYTAWQQQWPPMAAAFLAAAERTGAGLITVSNLYGYGPFDGVLTEETPLASTGKKGRIRARMWEDALAAQQRGGVRVTEVRPSDYFGADGRRQASFFNDFLMRPLLAGRTAWLPMGDPDAPHSWSYLPDIARLVAELAVRGESDDRVWGRPWHVPTSAPRSAREVAADLAELGLVRNPRVRRAPKLVMTAARVLPLIRELDETRYQFDRPFVLDASAAEEAFGMAPTPWADALRETCAGFAAQ